MSGLYDPSAERATLASILRFGSEAYVDVASYVKVSDFFVETNQVIYKCIQHIYNRDSSAVLDLPSLMIAAKELGFQDFLGKKTEQEHLRSIKNFPVSRDNVVKFALIVLKLSKTRELRAITEDIQSNLSAVTGNEPFNHIIGLAENPIFDFSQKLSNAEQESLQLIGKDAEELVQYWIDNPREVTGISSGFTIYDNILGGGLQEACVDVVAARMKTGKSIFGKDVGVHVADKQNIPVLYVDTEMDKKKQLARILAGMSGVPFWDIVKGKIGTMPEQETLVKQAAKRLSEIPLTYECVKGWQFEDIISLIRRWILRKVGLVTGGTANPCLIIMDYLKIMSASDIKNITEWQLLGFQFSALNDLVGKYNSSCLCLAQLNRDGINRQDSGVVAGSDRIGMYCTSLCYLRDKVQGDEDRKEYNMAMIPVLTRYGEPLYDGDYVNYNKIGKICKIVEGPTRNELNELNHLVPDEGFEIDDQETGTTTTECNTKSTRRKRKRSN